LTSTTPRLTVVSVPSQRSSTRQIVPRTVAAAWRPRVRNLPWPLPPQAAGGLRAAGGGAGGAAGARAPAGREVAAGEHELGDRLRRAGLGDPEDAAGEVGGLRAPVASAAA
jgi:hypothetical protein